MIRFVLPIPLLFFVSMTHADTTIKLLCEINLRYSAIGERDSNSHIKPIIEVSSNDRDGWISIYDDAALLTAITSANDGFINKSDKTKWDLRSYDKNIGTPPFDSEVKWIINRTTGRLHYYWATYRNKKRVSVDTGDGYCRKLDETKKIF